MQIILFACVFPSNTILTRPFNLTNGSKWKPLLPALLERGIAGKSGRETSPLHILDRSPFRTGLHQSSSLDVSIIYLMDSAILQSTKMLDKKLMLIVTYFRYNVNFFNIGLFYYKFIIFYVHASRNASGLLLTLYFIDTTKYWNFLLFVCMSFYILPLFCSGSYRLSTQVPIVYVTKKKSQTIPNRIFW